MSLSHTDSPTPRESTPPAAPVYFDYCEDPKGGYDIVKHFQHRGKPMRLEVAHAGTKDTAKLIVSGLNGNTDLAARVKELETALETAKAEKQALLALNRFDGKTISELTGALDEIRTHAQGNQSDAAYTLAVIDAIAREALNGGAK